MILFQITLPPALAEHDTDGDGIPDSWELTYGFDPDNPLDAGVDINGDGLSNLEEYTKGFDPLSRDTDSDGIINTAEVEGFFGFFTDPIREDTDDDGLSDLIEIAYYIDFTDERDIERLTSDNITYLKMLRTNYSYPLDPLNNDTDSDGLDDGDEIEEGTSPVRFDTDGDGLSDGDEVNRYATDPLKRDTDGDWLSDFEELQEGEDGYVTDPLDSDTDDDGMIDGEESMPLGSVPIPPSNHSLSFKEFVSGDLYAGEYVTTLGRVVNPPSVEADTSDLDRYTLELDDPLKNTAGVHIQLTIVNTTFHHLYDGEIQIFDDNFGFAIEPGDKLLIVGLAGRITGVKRPITIDASANGSNGTVFLVTDPVDLSRRDVSSRDHIKVRSDLSSTSSPILPAAGTPLSGGDDTGGEDGVTPAAPEPFMIFIDAESPSVMEDGNMTVRVTAYLTDRSGMPIDPSPLVEFNINSSDAWINETSRSVNGAFTSVNITTSDAGIVDLTASSSGLVSDEISIIFEKGGFSGLILYILVAVVLTGVAFVVIKKRKKGGAKHWIVDGVKKGKGGVYTVKIKRRGESKIVRLKKSEYAELKKNKQIKKDEYLIVMN
ncbi:MAG: hypothetical protein OCU18_06720 [Candidatus Syntrophoarchaeum sp.]|nr:hypothetical protein [Candidatus Syntrophoarchaeum sp.]